MKVRTVRPGPLLPHALRAIEVTRRRTDHHAGRTSTKAIYAVTGLSPEQAASAQLAAPIRGRWSIGVPHHREDVMFTEDGCHHGFTFSNRQCDG